MAERFAVIGAGPAGLAAARELAGRGLAPLVLEVDGCVGGLSRTVERGGWRCDIGGHRFFTKNADVERLWRQTLPADFLRRPRLSRIYYRGKFFKYPLEPANALWGLGLWTSARVMLSFLRRRAFPHADESGLEHWVANRFGDGLYRIFFKTYTEKVWGVPCAEISADWAAQRIRNLNLGRAVLGALGLGRGRKVASLIEEFDYPRLGPGQMYEELARAAQARGAELRLRREVVAVRRSGARVTALAVRDAAGRVEEAPVGAAVSTMPLTELVLRMDPPAPEAASAAARALRYRSIVTVNLMLRAREVLPDTWVYLHAPEIRAGRLQLYKNWSPAMVPDPEMSSLGFEYFAFEGDADWGRPDGELIRLAAEDLGRLRLASAPRVEDGFVVRYAKAYPLYESGYRGKIAAMRAFLDGIPNLACAGRYGQFRYNNMDHSIVTGWLAARRLLGESVDPWAVNEEAEYHEESAKRRGNYEL